MTDQAVTALAPQLGVRAACEAVGVAQAGYYRRHRQSRHRYGQSRFHTASVISRGR